MSEEPPFKSIKITLSEEALDILERLRKAGYFRSDSMTVEECLRTIDSISTQIVGNLLFAIQQKRPASIAEQSEWLRAVILRIARFIPRETWEQIKALADLRSSTGT